MLKTERFSSYSHLLGAVLFVFGLAILAAVTWGRWGYFIVSLIYGLGAVCLFTASALYHKNKRRENSYTIWRKLDHIAIFIMIAATYTPIAYAYLGGWWFWGIMIAQWFIVVLGIFYKFFLMKAPRVLSPILYLAMGWMAVIPIRELWLAMPAFSFILLFLGGVAYSIGAIIYALKKPNPIPGMFGFHEIFHVLILVGAILHYILVIEAVAA